MKTFVIPALAACLVLVACNPRERPNPYAFDATPRCGAADLQGLIAQDAGVLGEVDIDAPLRVVHPGMQLTADYNPTRLNIGVDGDGMITRVWCA